MNIIPDDTLEAAGKAIRTARMRVGLTIEALAAKTKISKTYLSFIETARARNLPKKDKLKAIERVLGLEPGSLVERFDWLRTPATVRAALAEMVTAAGGKK